MAGILDEIRNLVLEWAISLEKLGVKGDGLSFSDLEKERAHGVSLHVNGNVTIQSLGQSGGQTNQASGTNAHLNNHSLDMSTLPSIPSGDLLLLVGEFEKLRIALLTRASTAEDYTAIGAIAQAETAAREGQATLMSKAISDLGVAGDWALGVAKDIGVPLAIGAIKSYYGLPPT